MERHAAGAERARAAKLRVRTKRKIELHAAGHFELQARQDSGLEVRRLGRHPVSARRKKRNAVGTLAAGAHRTGVIRVEIGVRNRRARDACVGLAVEYATGNNALRRLRHELPRSQNEETPSQRRGTHGDFMMILHWEAETPFLSTAQPTFLQTADFNRDGKPDLLVGGLTILVLPN